MAWLAFFLGVLVGLLLAGLIIKSSMAKLEEDAYLLGYRAGRASRSETANDCRSSATTNK